MRHRFWIAALTAAALAGSTLATAAQTAQPPAATGPAVSPATPPAQPSAPVTTGTNTGATNQPGVPNTSTPGTIGTGAAPSGLAGDNASSPGYPGKVGR